MKRVFRFIGFITSVIAGLLGWSGKAFAPPTSITINRDIAFGTIYGSPSAGTVILAPAGTLSTTGGVTLFGGTVTSGLAFAKGNNLHQGSVTTIPVLTNGTGKTMTVKTFKFALTGGTFLGTNTFSMTPAGNTKVNIGATLHVNGSQAAGTYTGTFTVNWNKL